MLKNAYILEKSVNIVPNRTK